MPLMRNQPAVPNGAYCDFFTSQNSSKNWTCKHWTYEL